jgi:hypothetical protein
MNKNRILSGISALAAFVVAGCHSLDVTNPNDPNSSAISDPTTLEAVGAGAYRTFFNASMGLRSAGVLSTQARTFASSWNNGNLNFYSGIDIGANDTTTSPATWTRNTRSWQNDPSAAGRTSVEAFWNGGNDESAVLRPGYYSALTAANIALRGIRNDNVVIGDAAQTKRMETMSVLMQGMVYALLSLNFDKAYIVDETTDLTDPQVLAGLSYSNRKDVRDYAISKLNEAITLATANTFSTEAGWMGPGGPVYSNTDLAKIANTFAAMTLAWYPRDATETGTQVDWTAVRNYTQSGMASAKFFGFNGDGGTNWSGEFISWCNSLDTCRISTRLAHFMDPATQKDPFPLGIGNAQPNSPDARLGDGSFGDASMVKGFGNVPVTAGAGTDFAWSSQGAIQRPDRGYYQQSNVGQIRWDATGDQGPDGVYSNYGFMPIINGGINDLLHAEALLRIGGAGAGVAAAPLIDVTRVGRGGLSSATLVAATVGAPSDGPCMSNGKLAKDGSACTLWSELLYEQEIEYLGLIGSEFYNHRHNPNVTATAWEQIGTGIFNGPRLIQGLLPGTPREMPVPAKELGVKAQAIYTFGGSGAANSATP